MEKKVVAAIVVLTTVAALVVFSGVAYAAMGPSSARSGYGMMGSTGYGGSMMGRGAGYSGGMMGGQHDMMGNNGMGNWCSSCMGQCDRSSSLP